MFWHTMLLLFSPIYLMFGLVFRSEQARLILALYQQVLILQRQLGKRPSLIPAERLAPVLSGLLLGKAKLAEALRIVKPETLRMLSWRGTPIRQSRLGLTRTAGSAAARVTATEWGMDLPPEHPVERKGVAKARCDAPGCEPAPVAVSRGSQAASR